MEVISDVIEYPSFSSGQTLTSGQLTNLVNYFSLEGEDTRVFLIGRGILFGLEIEYNSAENSVTVRPGAGLSSNGQLFALEDSYKFIAAVNEQVKIAGITVNAQVLMGNKGDKTIQINENSIVVMQIETNEETINDCLQRFDRAGKKTKKQIRVAIIDAAVFTNAIINGWGNKNKPDEMKEILVPFLHRFGNSDTKLPEDQQAISFDGFTSWQKVKDNFNSVCEEGAAQIGGVYQTVFDTYAAQLGYSAIPNRFMNLPKELADKLREVYQSNGYRLPYFYDYLKDLVNACIEFLDTTIDVPEFSYPDKESFEDYISLGKALQPAPDDKYRMGWYRLPSGYSDRESIDKPKKLMERMILLANVNKSFISDQQLNNEKAYITPSPGLGFPLSAQPVPFYLTNKNDLRTVWNYEALRHKRLGSITGMSDSDDRKIFLRDMDAFSFFKIKGHAGFPMDIAKKQIEKLRTDLHLPFDIRVLYLGDATMETELIDEYKGCFTDLKLQLENALANLACDDACGDRILKMIFGGRNVTGDGYVLFEFIRAFFIQKEFLEDETEWRRHAMKICDSVCDDKEPLCCVAYLKLLYDLCQEFDRRRNEIQDEVFFHRFAKKHPGLEHNAGVYKGGTLFLVCSMDVKRDERIDNILDFVQKNNNNFRDSKTLELIQNITRLTVVADFCLPYICYSKCPSIKAEFYQVAPVADFIEKKRHPIMDDNTVKGQTITIENRSRNADTYKLTIFDSKGDTVAQNIVRLGDINFDLMLDKDTKFFVRLEAKRGSLTSTKDEWFDITPEASPADIKELHADRAKEYLASFEEMGSSDKTLTKLEKYTQTETFLGLTRKNNIDKDFWGLLDTFQSRFDSLTDIRKQQVTQLASLATAFYLDKQILNAGDVAPKTENELLKKAAGFIKSNKTKTEKLLPEWDAGPITTDGNKETIRAFKSMLE